ncbi:MAG TPA: hypothetical protein VLH09_06225 [Bryobacteraceae bacterium]|nr:hypothetical protein [Bryobacteraceae bacterium]
MFNARDAFNLLADSEKLDGLLAAARTTIKTAAPATTTAGADALDTKAAALQATMKAGAAAGQSLLAAKKAARAQKVAYVQHMISVLERIA